MARRPIPSRGPRIEFLLVAIMLVLPVLYGGSVLWDRMQRSQARPGVMADWPAARALVAARLKQSEAPEFGKVWATHHGTICGIVNGQGSFGGLTGMTPFYVSGGRVVFAIEADPMLFAAGWRDCNRDDWIEVVPGSKETGYCATRRGARSASCRVVG